ncbi:MAG: hypothetical protein AAGA48_36260 [Myxococcota bacterium]
MRIPNRSLAELFDYLRERIALDRDTPEDWSILGDALEDAGDPRAEPIRLEQRRFDTRLTRDEHAKTLARLAKLDRQNDPVHQVYRNGFLVEVWYRRGLPGEGAWLAELAKDEPLLSVLHIGIAHPWTEVVALLQRPGIRQIPALELDESSSEVLRAAGELTTLRSIRLRSGLGVILARHLAQAAWRPRSLVLESTTGGAVLSRLLDGPAFRGLEQLSLVASIPDLGDVAAQLPSLRRLEAGARPVRLAEVTRLVEALPDLTKLDVRIGSGAARESESGPPAEPVGTLTLDTTVFESPTFQSLCAQRWLPRIKAWSLRTTRALEALDDRAALRLEGLRRLMVGPAQAGVGTGVHETPDLARGTLRRIVDAAPHLTELDAGLPCGRDLCAWPGLGRLEHLGLAGPLAQEDVQALAANASSFAHLRSLHTVTGAWSGLPLQTLTQRTDLRLTELHLTDSNLDDLDVEALCRSDLLESVKSLVLSGRGITVRGVRALCRCPHLQGLRHLSIRKFHRMPADAFETIAKAPWPYLRSVLLRGGLERAEIEPTTAEAMRQQGIHVGV